MKARVTSNPYQLGNGHYPVGQIVEIERETPNYYVLVKSSYRINKEKLALTGWAGRYAHTIEFEIIEDEPTADPVAVNTEILVAVEETSSREGARRIVAETLAPLGQVSEVIDPISEHVTRLYARLSVGVAVRQALDLLYPLEFVITAYPLGAQDMIPDNPSPAMAPAAELPPAWSYHGGLDGEDHRWSREEWSREADAGNTQRGYWEWVEAMIEENEDAADLEVRAALATGAIVVMVARELVDAYTVAALGGWLNTNGLDSNFAVFPGDVTEILGPISPDNAAQLKAEVIAFIDDKSEDNPRAAVSVSDRWNGKPVNPLDWIGALRSVGACYSGVALDLGETLLRNGNELVITWDRSPGEAAEREIRDAVTQALDKLHPVSTAPKRITALSLEAPEKWRGRTIDRDALAAWCGRQGGDDFTVTLSPCKPASLAIYLVSGPRPLPGVERSILADARTWLNEVGTLDDDEADEPAAMPPCRLTLAVPETWKGDTVPRDAVADWCGTRSGQGIKLVLNPIPCATGGVVVSWVSGATPSSLDPALQRKLEAAAVDFLNSLAEDVQPVERSGLRLVVPITWYGEQVDRDALAAWLERMGRQWPASVQVELAEATNRVDVGATLSQESGPKVAPVLIEEILDDVAAWLNDMSGKLTGL
ncbi:hypothetical protein Ah13B_02 [Aeromonas phage AhMtk13b]|nr:hypothetical protein Ah13B_02 [Aeromonas phage AhMtk13b]